MHALGRRQLHVSSVAALAGCVARAVAGEAETLIAAALVHDIGYAEDLAVTGFHPLDGARAIRASGHEEVARLVAHHSGARTEAELRGIKGYLDEFPFEDSEHDHALTYCDLTTGPDGRRVRLEQRIQEIQERYGPEHVVSQAIRLGRPEFELTRVEIERGLAKAGIVISESLAYPH